MTIKTVFEDTRFQLARGTEQEWSDANPILAEGEEGVVFSEGRASYSKIGDGKTRWNDLEIFHGLQGDPGPQGEPGETGPEGQQGEKGKPGADGINGRDGVNGKQGKDGKPGKDGEPGEPGDTGEKGEPGAGLPPGGEPGQVPIKKSKEDFDTEWQYPTGGVMWTGSSGGGGASALDDLTDVTLALPLADHEVLQYDAGTLKWVNAVVAGTGDVVGPAGATADDIATFNGATGKIIKDSGKKTTDFAASIHAHAGADITSGTVDGDRLPALSVTKKGGVPATGIVSSTKYLRDDGTWQTPAGGGDVATDAIWDAAGDLVIGTGPNTAHRLAAGATTTILVGGGAADPVWTAATGTGAPARAGDPTFTGTVTIPTLDTGVAAAGVTLSGTTLAADGTDAAIDINITPKGTGEVNLPKVDIDAGTIDNVTIAGTTALKFGLTPTVVGTPDNGSIYWKATEETPTVQLHANVALPLGQKELRMVYNPSLTDTISRGSAVYTNGIGGTPTIVTVGLAQANAVATYQVLGLAAEDILPETQGFVIVRGHLGELDTSGFDGSAGDSLYLSATVPGGVTSTPPEAPNFEIRVGRLIVKNASGKVNVRITQSLSLDNLTDVQAASPVANQLLKFDGVSWVAADSAVVSSAGGTDFYPTDADGVIEGMTRAAACVVTWTSHGLATGSLVKFEGITQAGWTALNSPSGTANVFHTITWISADSFSIPVNTSGYAGDYVPATDPGTISSGKIFSAPDTTIATQTDSAQSTGSVEALIDSYCTPLPLGRTSITAGEWVFKTWCYASSTSDVNTVVIRVYKRSAAGTETLLFFVETADLSTTNTLSQISTIQPAYAILATDHLVFKYFAKSNRGGGSFRTCSITHNGTTNYSYVKTPLALAHNDLGGLQGGGSGAYYHIPAPSAPAAALMNVPGIVNGETTWSNKAIFDATSPEMNGAVAAGTATTASHRDHVHPVDTSRAPTNPLATDTLWDAAGDLVVGTGPNTAGKLAKGTTLQVLRVKADESTLEWAASAGGADPATAVPLPNGIAGLVGTTTKYAREDHVHPGTHILDPIGVEWDPSFSASASLQRVDVFGNILSAITPLSFTTHPTYAGIRRVNLADNGTVNAVYGDAGFKVDGSNGQVMVQVPKFWYKATKTGTRYQWLISSTAQTGFVVHPAFIKDTVEKDYFYLSAFEGSVYDVSAAATEVNTIEVTHVPTSNGAMVLTINTGPAIGVSVTTADSIENIVDRIVALGVQVDAFGVTWTPAKTSSSTLTYTASVARVATTLTLPTAYGVTSTITKTTSGAGGYLTADNAGVDVTATTGDKLCSVAAVKPASSKNTNITLPSFRTLAHNRGSGWELQTFNQISAIQLLYLVEYANFDTQSTIGAGVSAITDDGSTNMAIPTGYTAGIGTNGVQLGNTTGECPLVVSGAYAAKAMSYRGVENFYGNIWKWVDGINIKADRQPWIADHDYVSDQFSHPYVNTGLANGATDGYISNIGFNSTMNYGFIPSAVGGSSSTYIPDYYYQTTGNKSALLGGYWYHGANAGAFSLDLNNAASFVHRTVGARLSFWP